MKQFLYNLNLTDEDGRLNFLHGAFVFIMGYSCVLPGATSALLLGIGLGLIGLELFLKPKTAKKATVDDIEECQKSIEKVSKDLRSLNMKLGFRQ